jgi:hypothetical protein
LFQQIHTLEQRRARSIELGDLVDACIEAMKVRDEACDLHEQHIALRTDEVYRLMMWGSARRVGGRRKKFGITSFFGTRAMSDRDQRFA